MGSEEVGMGSKESEEEVINFLEVRKFGRGQTNEQGERPELEEPTSESPAPEALPDSQPQTAGEHPER